MASSVPARKRPRRSSSPDFAVNGNISTLGLGRVFPPSQNGSGTMCEQNRTASPIDTALHVISSERSALENVQQIYARDKFARDSMDRAIRQISSTIRLGGKVVLSGVGKSGLIARKVSASMNSMGIHSSFLHPTEALHGDLGMVRQNDTVIVITFSGKTPEVMALVPHLPPTAAIIAITSHMDPSECPLLTVARQSNAILLPAPVHEPETTSFGLPAPMTSTTVALAISDGLTLASARAIYPEPGNGPAELFRQFHPGGAIGATLSSASSKSPSVLSSPFSPPSTSATPLSSSTVNTSSQPAHQGTRDSLSASGRTLDHLMTPRLKIPNQSLFKDQ